MVMSADRQHKKKMIGLSLFYLMSTQMMDVTYLHATKMQWSWRCWYWGDVDLRCEPRWRKLWYAKSMYYCNDYVSSRAWKSTCIFCSMKIDTSRCTTLMIHSWKVLQADLNLHSFVIWSCFTGSKRIVQCWWMRHMGCASIQSNNNLTYRDLTQDLWNCKWFFLRINVAF